MAPPRGNAEQNVEQVSHLAFNTCGWAAEIPPAASNTIFSSHETEIIRIKARYLSSTTYRTVINKSKNSELTFRSSLAPSKPEMEGVDSSRIDECFDYVVVGLVPRTLEDRHSKLHRSQTKQKPVGTVEPDVSEDVFLYHANASPEELPLIAVARDSLQEQPTSVKLYVLLEPKDGLCTPYVASQKDVFYLPRFRDLTTDHKSRGPNWNKLVLEVVTRTSGKEAATNPTDSIDLDQYNNLALDCD